MTRFIDFDRRQAAFAVHAKRSGFVPEISDQRFRTHDAYAAEDDVPYQQRACVDLAAQGKVWMFDTGGQHRTLKGLCCDIVTTPFRAWVIYI